MKTLLLAIHILMTQYNIEAPRDIPTGLAYSWSRADCQLNDNWEACKMACMSDTEYLNDDTIIKATPACETVIRDMRGANE